MLMTKLSATLAAGVALGFFAGWPVAAFCVAIVATALTLSQIRREVDDLRAGVE